MSLADCVKCWSNPCTCGYVYENWTNDEIYDEIVMLIRKLTIKNSQPLSPIIETICQKSNERGIH
jgi:hypothetical protein